MFKIRSAKNDKNDSATKIKPEYQKMLNNLLGISNQDNAIMASSRTANFDLQKLLVPKDYQKILESNDFKLEFKNISNDIILEELKSAQNADEFIEIIEESGLFLAIRDRKLLVKKYRSTKSKIIEKITNNQGQKVAKWKKFQNRYLDKQVQINSWPLYVGTMFVKVKTEKSSLYGPLILKKVALEINNQNQVKIKTLDKSVEINDKLLFLLKEEFKLNLPKINEENEYSFLEAVELLKPALKTLTNNQRIVLKGQYHYHNRNTIKNKDLTIVPGIILTLQVPSGGKLRDKLIQLIKDNKIEDLLDFDILKNLDQEINADINNKKSILRITPTDLSQEKAIIGSLKESSVIWGPPGTGKSQTIANLLANLLHQDKRVLVTSEKKAALDVIQERMGKLGKFMFFGLTDKNVNKKQFYKPFVELAKVVKNDLFVEKQISSSIIPDSYFDYWNQEAYLANEKIDSIIFIKIALKEKYPFLKKHIKNYDRAVKKVPEIVEKLEENGNIFQILADAKINKSKIFRQYPLKARMIIKLMKKINGDVSFIKHLSQIKNINYLIQWKDLLLIEHNYQKQKFTFANDEDFLDALLTKRFREKIIKLQQDPQYKKRINSFIKNSSSGFRVPYKFVNLYQDIIAKLFNVFISTPQTLAASINMDEEYDYAIFDEASQLHLEKALPFLALAKKAIIAGDSQQMRPTNWMSVRDKTILTEEAEEDVDSLLDYADRKGLMQARQYMLTKNYRSNYAELMAFSSKNFYQNRLDVIDKCLPKTNAKPIELYNAKGKWEARANEQEAVLALDKLSQIFKQYSKVILLTLNASQKQFIESLIYSNIKYQQVIQGLQSGQIVLRNLENIQGDEADLVIVSVAYDKHTPLSTTYVARPEGKNALNVAISRAKSKIIIYKSIKASEVKVNATNPSLKIFRDWLTFLELGAKEQKNYSFKQIEKNNSKNNHFIMKVSDSLEKNLILGKELFLINDYQIGSYHLSQAIVKGNEEEIILGIKIVNYEKTNDNFAHHQDLEQNMFLKVKKYPIFFINELTWKSNAQKIINKIQSLIN